MEFAEVIRRRRMVRNYDPDRAVPPDVVDRLLENAVRAPSAGFSQGWGFLVLETPTDRARFWAATTPDGRREGRWLTGMRRAPLIVVPHSDRSAYLDRYAEPDKASVPLRHSATTASAADSGGATVAGAGVLEPTAEAPWSVPYWDIDTGFAALLMLLTAVDEGLGACFFGIPRGRVQRFRDEFGVPARFTPIGAITVGYRAPDHRSASLRRGRRPMDQVVHRGRWS